MKSLIDLLFATDSHQGEGEEKGAVNIYRTMSYALNIWIIQLLEYQSSSWQP